jgi:anti-sigma factor RsiW
MRNCESIRSQLIIYLDDELHNGELAEVETHLKDCPICRDYYARDRRLLDEIRAAKPLYTTPEELRARVGEILEEAPDAFVTPESLRRSVRRIVHPGWASGREKRISKRSIGIAAAVLAVLLLGLWGAIWSGPRMRTPSEFAMMAVDTHQRRVRNQLPLEIVSDSPGKISEWFAGKVSFGLELPNYQEASGQEKLYQLEGARLVGFRGDYAAFVAYQMRNRPITLVVTSNAVATPSGGELIVSKGLKFHYDAINGLKVTTWTHRGLTYALVSDLEERGQQSCIVCHEGTKDRDFIEDFKPSRWGL